MPRIRTDNPPLQKVGITVPPMTSFVEVRQVLTQLITDFQSQLIEQFPITNYEGRRISNVGVPVAADDVVTLRYLMGTTQTPAEPIVKDGKPAGPFLRTIDLKDTTVGNNIADVVVVHGAKTGQASTVVLVAGVLRTAISTSLTLRINNVTTGGTNVVGTFTIPSATAVNTPVAFTTFTTSTLPDLSALTWDVTASDGSVAADGVASFSIWWM
jgi:hypothetical protein